MKALRLYAPLVGFPLLGLIIVLHAGEHLAAPPSLHGDWLVRAVPSGSAETGGRIGCVARSAAALHRLSISQSGPHLQIALLDADGDVLARTSAQVETDSATSDVIGDASCERRLTLAFAGRIPDSLRIAFATAGCSDCEPAAFTAIRRRQPRE